jgi:hypothetical protein
MYWKAGPETDEPFLLHEDEQEESKSNMINKAIAESIISSFGVIRPPNEPRTRLVRLSSASLRVFESHLQIVIPVFA